MDVGAADTRGGDKRCFVSVAANWGSTRNKAAIVRVSKQLAGVQRAKGESALGE